MSLASNPSRLSAFAGKALDFLLPPLCLSCEAPVGQVRTLCPACFNNIHFIATPYCHTCGAPFEVPMGEGALCGGCIADPPEFKAVRAPMLYGDARPRIACSF